ncbi:nuclear transport factor 2 family protein [Kitasatospora sp. NPDC052896]|uniref:nuclear transport factor 2 family protein n=1 Tax=Kitasatospora sp. NPDC052896 TaxID=3364061 RepID=UPI0037C63F48
MKLSSPRAMTTLIGAAAVATALTSTAAAAQPAKQHLPRIVSSWAAAWNGTDPQALGALFATDGTYTDQAVGVTFHGRQEISGWKARADSSIDNVHVTVRAAYHDGDHITIEAIYSGHLKGAPKPFAVPMATLLDLDSHRQITSNQDYYNLNAVLTQSGLPTNWTPPTSS